MNFRRIQELGALRALLDQPSPQFVRVTGLRGGGKSSLVRSVLSDYEAIYVHLHPRPEQALLEQCAAAISAHQAAHRSTAPPAEDHPPREWRITWEGLVGLAAEAPRPIVLVLDDAHRLNEARARYLTPLLTALGRAAAAARPLHVVLVGDEAGVAAPPSSETIPVSTVTVGPLALRTVLSRLPGSTPVDLLRAYAVFGGIPAVLALVDPDVSLGTNLRRLLLDSGAPLADIGLSWLERSVQAPARYVAILEALASGASDWSRVRAAIPELGGSGQAAPYLKRLSELGWVTARRSLDARPNARSTRYTLTDPFLAFWFGFVLGSGPHRPGDGGTAEYTRRLRRQVDACAARTFAQVCRQHMRLDAMETLGATAREGGSLWGPGYDVPVAGLLASGAAYYGLPLWAPPTRESAPLDRLDRDIRETRYGFGREHRVRLVFTGSSTPRWLQREVARRHDARLIDAADLCGEHGS